MSATTDRDLVCRIASTEPERALRIARGIADPWFRCQALSGVAEAENDLKARRRLIRESLEAAGEQSEAPPIVMVSAWPLQVMCRSGWMDEVRTEVARLLALIAPEPHAVRRAHAVFELIYRLREGPEDIYPALLDALQAACLAMPPKAKKKEWLMRYGVVYAADIAPERARALAELIHRPNLRREAFAALERHEDKASPPPHGAIDLAPLSRDAVPRSPTAIP
ncbi:MAG TPA: hypothetical protein VGM37_20915 [Armatimonadota bacterium]|jgi:hypothetical protein